MGWVGHVAYGGKTKRIQGLVGKPQEKRQFGTPSCRWLYNIKVGHEYILWAVVDWIHLAEDTQKR